MTEVDVPIKIKTEAKAPDALGSSMPAFEGEDEPLLEKNDEGDQSQNQTGKKMTSIKLEKNPTVLTPLSNLWNRATSMASNASTSIHPEVISDLTNKVKSSIHPEVISDLTNKVKSSIHPEVISNITDKVKSSFEPAPDGALSENPNVHTVRKQALSLYALTAIPAALTMYRAFFANGGPTFFSFHPMMMMVSIFSMLTALLLQRYGGSRNITWIGSLSVTSVVSMVLSLFAVWSTKEMYAKVHLLSMHSHLGGMTIGGLLAYVLGVFYCFDPVTGTERADKKWQQYLVTLGKGTATLALCSQLLGVFEVERTWTFLFVWWSALFLITPFVILPWNK